MEITCEHLQVINTNYKDNGNNMRTFKERVTITIICLVNCKVNENNNNI